MLSEYDVQAARKKPEGSAKKMACPRALLQCKRSVTLYVETGHEPLDLNEGLYHGSATCAPADGMG